MTVWLYELLDASMTCGDKKGMFMALRKNTTSKGVWRFFRNDMNVTFASRSIWRATYTCPHVSVMS